MTRVSSAESGACIERAHAATGLSHDHLRGEILSLTALRGVAALWVVAYHAAETIKTPPPRVFAATLWTGFLAVDLFFVLSGFILVLVYQNLVPRNSARFFIKRLMRVYPLDIVMMLVLLANAGWQGKLGSGWYAWDSFIPVLLMVEPFWPGPPIFGWLIANWSAGVELLCYLLFPVLLLTLRRMSPPVLCLLVLAFSVAEIVTQIGCLGCFFGPGAAMRGLCGFGLGAALGTLLRQAPVPDGRIVAVGEFVCLIGLLASINWPVLPAVPIWSAGLIACLAWQTGPISRALRTAPLVWLGNISFSIYLLHDPLLLECGVPAIALLRRLLPEFPVLALLIWSSLLVTVLLGLSTATYHLVEQPGRRLGNLLARRLRRT